MTAPKFKIGDTVDALGSGSNIEHWGGTVIDVLPVDSRGFTHGTEGWHLWAVTWDVQVLWDRDDSYEAEPCDQPWYDEEELRLS